MSRPGATLALASLAACLGAFGCGSATKTDSVGRSAPAASGPTGACPVTIPDGLRPPGERQRIGEHGNGVLWTELPPNGTILAKRQWVRADGSIRVKFPWWGSRRAGKALRIVGMSLGSRARRPRAEISVGVTSAPRFWASAVVFPGEGCWRLTATAGRASLTVAVFVAKAGAA